MACLTLVLADSHSIAVSGVQEPTKASLLAFEAGKGRPARVAEVTDYNAFEKSASLQCCPAASCALVWYSPQRLGHEQGDTSKFQFTGMLQGLTAKAGISCRWS